jgi:SanA protein
MTSAAIVPGGIDFARGASSRRGPRVPRLVRRIALFAALFATTALLLVAAINLFMAVSVRGQQTTVADAPHAQAAIVLGALVNADGSMSVMLADRVRRGAELYKAGKVDRVIVSGDHHTWSYDEPDTMRKALQAQGVPAHAIFTDHAGFNTRASMVRAREVFNVSSAIVVTQKFHMTRALYLANRAGLRASGVSSDFNAYGNQGLKSNVREVPARVKSFASALLGTHVLLGPVLPITGDGRSSWGPQHPPR